MEKIIEILKTIRPDVDFETEEDLMEDGILDSLAIGRLIAKIDEAYDIKIKVTDLKPAYFRSAKTIYELVQRLEDE